MVAIDFFLQDFEIDRIKKFTAENERILIQLPNHLLKFSVPLIKALPNAVLSEHKCCLEQLNHSNHECIVHFGQSCLSNSVQKYLLIFEKLDLDVKKLKESIDGFDKVLLLCDVDYYHALIDIKMDNVICCQIKTDSEMQIITDHCIQGYYFNYRGDFADLTVVYIGRESLCMTNIAMSFATSAFYSFDPVNNTLQKRNESMLLNRRFFLVQKVKVANVIGIVVGTTNCK
jgi:diphthamide biosynthesis enzyme Dph1/Dph2-like protein